jgi:hypothetical protein
MISLKWFRAILLSLIAVAAGFVGSAQANPPNPRPAVKTAKVQGKWRIAWDVRLGTVRGILVLKQNGSTVTGTFQDDRGSYPFSGTVQGQAITFDVSFTGPPPYTIEFKGSVDGEKISDTSGLQNGERGFLGHAGEINEPQRPWTATKGLKKQNNAPGKRPDDDDDDDGH